MITLKIELDPRIPTGNQTELIAAMKNITPGAVSGIASGISMMIDTENYNHNNLVSKLKIKYVSLTT